MNSKSAKQVIDIKVPVTPGGRHVTVVKPKSQKRKKQRSKSSGKFMAASSSTDYHYAASILDPWGVSGVRIPDSRTDASFTCRSFVRGTIPAVQSFDGSDYGVGLVMDVTPSAVNSGALPVWLMVAGAAGRTWRFNPSIAMPNALGIRTNGGQLRPVSCGLSLMYTGALLDTQGTIVAGSVARGGTAIAQATDYTSGALAQFTNTRTCAVRPNEICSVVWTPPEPTFLQYRLYTDNTGLGQIFIAATGIKVSATFEYTFVVNWEVTPIIATNGLIPTQISTCNMKALEIAANVIATRSVFHTVAEDVKNASANNANSNDDGGYITWAVRKFTSQDYRKDFLGPAVQGINNLVTTGQFLKGAYEFGRHALFGEGTVGSYNALKYSPGNPGPMT